MNQQEWPVKAKKTWPVKAKTHRNVWVSPPLSGKTPVWWMFSLKETGGWPINLTVFSWRSDEYGRTFNQNYMVAVPENELKYVAHPLSIAPSVLNQTHHFRHIFNTRQTWATNMGWSTIPFLPKTPLGDGRPKLGRGSRWGKPKNRRRSSAWSRRRWCRWCRWCFTWGGNNMKWGKILKRFSTWHDIGMLMIKLIIQSSFFTVCFVLYHQFWCLRSHFMQLFPRLLTRMAHPIGIVRGNLTLLDGCEPYRITIFYLY